MAKQRTIEHPISYEGVGIHTGKTTTATFKPGAVNTGIVFVRTDLGRPLRVEALVANRVEIPRRTTLQTSDTTVEMVEHIMASFAGLHIREDRISLNPKLPEGWRRIKFRIRYKNIWFHIHVTKGQLKVSVQPLQESFLISKPEIPIEIKKKMHKLLPGKEYAFPI